jgi:CRP-like cAMP-binding protein
MADKSDLKKQRLFSDLTDAELDMMAKSVVVENHAKGKPIFKEGEPTKGLYLVKSGKVEISKATPDGWKQTLAVIADNHIFGELSVIEDKKNHGADATAIETTEVYRISIDDFNENDGAHRKQERAHDERKTHEAPDQLLMVFSGEYL